jgi:hypothetical protein
MTVVNNFSTPQQLENYFGARRDCSGALRAVPEFVPALM